MENYSESDWKRDLEYARLKYNDLQEGYERERKAPFGYAVSNGFIQDTINACEKIRNIPRTLLNAGDCEMMMEMLKIDITSDLSIEKKTYKKTSEKMHIQKEVIRYTILEPSKEIRVSSFYVNEKQSLILEMSGYDTILRACDYAFIHNASEPKTHLGVMMLPIKIDKDFDNVKILVCRKRTKTEHFQWDVCHDHITVADCKFARMRDKIPMTSSSFIKASMRMLNSILYFKKGFIIRNRYNRECDYEPPFVPPFVELMDLDVEGRTCKDDYEKEKTKVYGYFVSEELRDICIREPYINSLGELGYYELPTEYIDFERLIKMYCLNPETFTIGFAYFLETFATNPDGGAVFHKILKEGAQKLESEVNACKQYLDNL